MGMDLYRTKDRAYFRWSIVKRVLVAMGYEPTYGNFRLWDPILDWRATAKLMDKPPVRTALCHILDGSGKVVRHLGEPVVVARDIEADNEVEAAAILRRSSHVFVRWWPPESTKPGVYDGDDQREIHDAADSKRNMECHSKTPICHGNDGALSGHIRREGPETLPSAARWLRKKLLPGCRLEKTLKEEAKSDGISLKELYEAKGALSVKSEWCGYGADHKEIKHEDGSVTTKMLPDMKFWSLSE